MTHENYITSNFKSVSHLQFTLPNLETVSVTAHAISLHDKAATEVCFPGPFLLNQRLPRLRHLTRYGQYSQLDHVQIGDSQKSKKLFTSLQCSVLWAG
jgi:hypothetical protein